jgi:hypothetical protein
MTSPRRSIIGLTILSVVLAADLAWLWQAVRGGHSIFGFDARGFDALILPMATILALGPNIILRRGRTHRFLRGFEMSGWLTVLACAICGWLSPNTVRLLLRPISMTWGLWSPWQPPDWYFFLADIPFILVPQLLIAVVGGWLAEKPGTSPLRVPRIRISIRGMMALVAIVALMSLGLARWQSYRQENDPWRNAVRWAEEHEAHVRDHLEAARRFPETAGVRLRMADFEKSMARTFQAEAKRLKP